MACDICGKTGCQLERLNDEYQTTDIKDICSECAKDVNDHLWKLRAMTTKMNQGWLKTFMQNMREKLKGSNAK